MKSRLSEKNKRRIIILGGVAAAIGLFLLLLPMGIRWGASKWLTDQGVVTQIEDIDLNLFTGRFAITNAHGETAQGNGFKIEHALVNLRYWPLFFKQIYLSDLELRNSRVDVRVDEDGKMSVAGIPIPSGEPEPEEPEEESTPWGFGLDRAAIGALTLLYEQPDFKREVTLSSSSTSDLATWEPNQPFPLDAALTIGDSQIKLDGELKPFGDRITGDITVGITNFALDLVAPIAKQNGVARLAGLINTKLDINLDYEAAKGLQLIVDGGANVKGATLAMPDLRLNNADVDWKGNIQAMVLQRGDSTDQVKTDGRLTIGKVDVALPDTLAFRQKNADWQGTLNAQLGEPLSVAANGALTLDATHLDLYESAAKPKEAAADEVQADTAAEDAAEPASEATAEVTAETQLDSTQQTANEPEPQTEPETVVEPKLEPEPGPETTVAPDTEAADTTETKTAEKPSQPQVPKTSDTSESEAITAETQAAPAAKKAARSNKPKTLTLDQGKTSWKGKITADLGQPLSVKTDGSFSLKNTQLEMPGQLSLAQDALNWKGAINTTLNELGAALGAKGQLTTNNTAFALETDGTAINQATIDWQGDIQMTPGEKGPSIKADGKLATNETDLSLPASGIKLLQQALSWEGKVDYAPGEPALVHASGALQADGTNLDLAPQNMAITSDRIAWAGDIALDPAAEGMPEQSELPLKVVGKLDGTGILVRDTALAKALAKVGEFALNDVAITGLNDIRSASVSVSDISALERAEGAIRFDKYPYISALKNVSLERVALTNQNRLDLGNATISGIDALLYRGPKEPGWEAAQWFGPGGEETAEKQAPATPTETEPTQTAKPAFQFALNSAKIVDSQLKIDDRGVSPAFETDLSNLRVTLADMDSAKPGQGSALDIFSALGRYGSIKANGIINPFLEPPSANITGKINAVNLAPISGYTAQAIDRRIDQGTFSADLKLNLDRGNIDANAELTLTKLRIGGAQNESGIVKNNLGLPLNKILSLLRDDNGNITLNLPVGGNLENPEFSVLDIVRKAIFTSLKKAVLVIYSPIALGKGLIDLATALQLDPILYEPGKSELDDTDRTFLDKVAAKLTKRPQTELIVCGHAVPADRTAMNLPDPSATVIEGETPPTPEQLAEARDKLFNLAAERTSLVGDYFVSKNITSDRLVLCNPALGEPETALPRTSLSF